MQRLPRLAVLTHPVVVPTNRDEMAVVHESIDERRHGGLRRKWRRRRGREFSRKLARHTPQRSRKTREWNHESQQDERTNIPRLGRPPPQVCRKDQDRRDDHKSEGYFEGRQHGLYGYVAHADFVRR